MKKAMLTTCWILSVFSLLLLLGCTATAAKKSAQSVEDDLTVCPDPRPEMCAMNYAPVCGVLKDGSSKTYSNGCNACSDPQVVGYRDGECK